MQGFQRKKQIAHVISSPLVLLFLVFVAVFLGRATYRILAKERESAKNLARAQAELQELQDKKEGIEKDINRLSTPEGVEEELRSKYAIKKPGEELVVIVNDEPAPAKEEVKEKTWWEKIEEFFGF